MTATSSLSGAADERVPCRRCRRRRTEHRFELTLSDPNIIGMRRAAQRMLGAAQKKVAEMAEKPTDDVTPLLEAELTAMAQA